MAGQPYKLIITWLRCSFKVMIVMVPVCNKACAAAWLIFQLQFYLAGCKQMFERKVENFNNPLITWICV